MTENTIVFYDDLTDSDNWAAAMFLQRAALKSSFTNIIWIVEPRQVSLGLSMTGDQINECKDLLKRYFPLCGDPFKALWGGVVRQDDLDKRKESLAPCDYDLLKLAIKPPYGPKEDAMLHGSLMALDLLTCLTCWPDNEAKTNVFLDVDSLDSLENPVNLNVHHHEELVARTKEELESYQAIMAEPHSERVKSLRGWYQRCIEPLQKATRQNGNTVSDLDLDSFYEKVKAAKSVKFFGGASLGLLERLIHKGTVSNVQCYLQAGAFDLANTIFNNQFNIALNPIAAKFVFSKFKEFENFVIIPTDTTKRVKYSLVGLGPVGPSLRRRCLGFNCRVDPMTLATGEASLYEFPDKVCFMADLTALFCAFRPGFGGSRVAYADQVDHRGQLILRAKNTGIKVCKIQEEIFLKKKEIDELLWTLTVDGELK